MRKVLFAALAVFIFSLVLYYPCWENPFVLDDWTKIQQNTDLRGSFSLERFVYPYGTRMDFRNDPSRPLTYILYWLAWQVGEGSARPFHVMNTVLHAGVAALLVIFTYSLYSLLCAEFSVIPALLAGLLFLTSPLMAGTVVYAFGLSDVLGTFLSLLCLCLLLKKDPSPWRLGGALLAFVLALGAKQTSIVIPAMVLALDHSLGWLKVRRRVYILLVAVAALYLAARWYYFGGVGDLEGQNELLPSVVYFPPESVLIFKYIWLSVFPYPLTVDHRIFPDFVPAGVGIAGWLLIGGLSFWAWHARKKIVAVGWLLFLFSLLPTSSLLPTVDLFVERRAYFAGVGIFLVAGIFLWKLFRGRLQWIALTAVALVGGQAAMSRSRIEVYGSVEKLWLESLAIDPQNPRALVNLSVYYSSVERFAESRKILEELLRQQPENGAYWSKLAYIYQAPGYPEHDDSKAWEAYQKALLYSPNNIFALYNAGVFQLAHGHPAESEQYFSQATRLSPQMAMSYLAWAKAEIAQGKWPEAELHLQKALEAQPDLSEAEQLLAKVRARK